MTNTFVDLSADPGELQRMLQALRLAQPGESPTTQMLTGGVSSSIFRVDLRSGPVCVKQALPKLKVAKDWYAPTSRVLAEMDWLSAVHKIAPAHVPRMLGTDRQRGAFVMEFLPGLTDWKTDLLAGHVDPIVGEQVSVLLARIHQATANDAEVARQFAHDPNFFALRLEPYLIETARVHPDLARELVALVHVTQNTPLGLVHGDVSPKNIMLRQSGPVLLDAECACYGDPAFDLAFLLNHALLKSVHLPHRRPELLALYERMVGSYLPLINWEPSAAFEARCTHLLPGLLLARIDGKSPVEYLNEGGREQVRRIARRLLRSPEHQLLALLDAWRAVMSPSR